MNTLDKNNFHYTSLFCEENIWKLIESSFTSNIIKPVDVLFIINELNSVALFEQNISNGNQAVIWDYHVVLTALVDNQLKILDFDSRCEFPCDINTYFNKTFINYSLLENCYKPCIKAIPAEFYYHNFTSTRQHMKGIIAESEYPKHELIIPDNTTNLITLEDCRAFDIDNRQNNHHRGILTPLEYLESMTTPNQ